MKLRFLKTRVKQLSRRWVKSLFNSSKDIHKYSKAYSCLDLTLANSELERSSLSGRLNTMRYLTSFGLTQMLLISLNVKYIKKTLTYTLHPVSTQLILRLLSAIAKRINSLQFTMTGHKLAQYSTISLSSFWSTERFRRMILVEFLRIWFTKRKNIWESILKSRQCMMKQRLEERNREVFKLSGHSITISLKRIHRLTSTTIPMII